MMLIVVLLKCWKLIFLDLILRNTVLNISRIASKKTMEIIVKLLLLSFEEMLIDVLNIIMDFEHL